MAGEKLTKTQKGHVNDMIGAMRRFEWDMHMQVARAGRIPPEWQEIWESRRPEREHVTARIDRDVMKMLRSMGPNVGGRINDILRAFVHARLGGLIEGRDLAEEYREAWEGTQKPDASVINVMYERSKG
ncbi:BrnA antitoxin family protein [uncultured Jannaschia sp.]|uniref:BrnA antitoxin family protein n=1 Tax=uncultured Jannaschia sp. TaxID=293347 RepID=UPI00261DE50F|nr:BrnA antitoxin family protein [uncultured Jannaschia sp.]